MSTEATQTPVGILGCIKYAAGTDIGKRREENQDSFGVIESEQFRIYIVADGMGGVQGGAVASNLAISIMRDDLKDKVDLSVDDVRAAVQHANAAIFEKGSEDSALSGMGTTLVGIAFVGVSMLVANVGDSRLYRLRDKRIRQLSEDHTLVRELLKSGTITPGQAENHPVAHMLTRSLGPTPEVEVDCWALNDGPARGDLYLLCSDGLYNLVGERDLIEILTQNDLDSAIQKCIDLANERGGTDNITVIIVQLGEDFPIGPEEFPDDPHALGLEDTVELYPPQYNPHAQAAVNGTAADAANGVDQAATDDASEDSPRIEPGVSIERVSSSVQQEGRVDKADRAQAAPEREEKKPQLSSGFELGNRSLVALVLVAGIVIGSVGFWLFDFGARARSADPSQTVVGLREGESPDVSAPVPVAAEIAPVDVFLPLSIGASRLTTTLPPLGLAGASEEFGLGRDDPTAEVYNGLTRHEAEGITARKRTLGDFIEGMEWKISALSGPLSGKTAEKLKQASQERERLKGKFQEVQAEMDTMARRLAIWYGRQKRLQSTEPVNLASEVAVTSQSVREKKEIFERATWAYLKDAEDLRYNPNNKELRDKVETSLKVRKQRMAELSREVRDAIEIEVRASDRRLAELTFERDKLQNELDAAAKEVEQMQVIMGGDSRARSVLLEELKAKLQVSRAEYEELNNLLPDQASSQPHKAFEP